MILPIFSVIVLTELCYFIGLISLYTSSAVIGCSVGFLYFKLGPKELTLRFKVLPRDLKYLKKVVIVLVKSLTYYAKNDTIATVFSRQVSSRPNKPAILFEEQSWSFKDIDNYSNKIGQFFKSKGLQYGLAKIGVRGAFLNCNLTGQSLLHCINTVGTKALVYEECFETTISSVYSDLQEKGIQVYCIRDKQGEEEKEESIIVGDDFVKEINKVSSTQPPTPSKLTTNDVVCYIYTSGTTGLPKAVPISHIRFLAGGTVYSTACSNTHRDTLYICLPLYHISGGTMSMGQMITRGLTAALTRKFSAKRFWKDCIKYKCTCFMYVGEICRYILSVPPSSSDKEHFIRVAFGNGLRRDIWAQFRDRFNIQQLVECYGSTEGNAILLNTEGKEGAIGFKTISIPELSSYFLIKVDLESGAIERNKDGLCSEVPCGERGLLVSRLMKDPIRKYAGYTNKDATNKKILSDVFKQGDTYFNTGDIMYMDSEGYYYFSDRVGDTFRWKGENVSTTEVENAISSLLPSSTSDVIVVFGVELPQTDGRAGMAVLPKGMNIKVSELYTQLKTLLPSYAIPIFLRFVDSVDLTGTFKLQKTRYRKEGYDLSVTGDDEVYMFDKSQSMYVPFNEEQYRMIQDGTLRF